MVANTLDAVVIDHELSSRQSLVARLRKDLPQVRLIERGQTDADILESIEYERPDLIFWDFGLFRQQASDLFARFGEPLPFDVVLVGTHQQFADKRLPLLNYLEKPIAHQKLSQLISLIQERRQVQQLLERVETLTHMLGRVLSPMVELPTMEGFDLIPVTQIMYCRAQNNYTQVILCDQRRLMVTRTLKDIERSLQPHPFVRIHKQHLIHLRYMTRYLKGDGGQVMMQDGNLLNVSRSRKEELKLACRGGL